TNNPFGGSSSNPVSTVTIRNTLDIPLGFTIRISGMTFQFAPRITTPVPDQVAGGRVIVERGIASPFKKGGTLILDNSTFTSYDGCGNGMWEGIEVRGFGGNSPVTQGTNFNNSVQGWLSVLNNSVISNAYIGAIAARYATSFPLSISYDMTQTGGVIQAVSSTFKNNQCGVVFMTFSEPTNPLHNRSFFTKCNFQTTSFLLNDNASQFQFFVDMYGTNGIIFKGNNFENSRPVISNTDITHNGLGIFSYNAGFSVVPFCITYNCTGFTKNTFKNLAYGIQVWSSNSITPVKIDQTDFTGNFRGIFLNYLNYSTITTNTFKVLEYSNSQPLTSSYGLYLNGCSGYQVEGNDFAYSFSPPTNPTTDGTYGIIVSNSGDNNNLIYRNTFHQIYIGIQAQRKNCEVTIANLNTSNPVNDQGLKMKCNSFDANAIGDYDIVEPNGCIDYHQGDFNPVNLSASANNCFDNSGTHINYYLDPQTTQTDPYTGYPYGVIPIHYVYPTGSCYLPLQYTTNKIGLTPSLVGSLCTSQITGCAYCPQAKIASAVQQKNYLIGLIDGGQTTYLLNQINSNISPGQLKNILIASSPYLSDDVLIAFVNKTSLPNGIVKDVLIANSPLRASVKSAIQNRTSPFPSGIMNNINAVQNGISPMDILLGKISEAQSIRDLSVDELIRQYLYDTTLTNGLDSVQLALKRYGVNLEDKCKLAAAQITAKDYAGATATLDTIRILNGGTLDNSCKLLDLLMRLQQSTNGYYSIKTDPAFASDSVTVSQMASDQNVEAYIGAQAMMKAIFLVSYQEPIDPVPHNSARIAQPTNNISNSELGKIFPNPNNGTMSFNYEIPVGSKGILLLYDISGKQVDSFVLKEGLNTEQISEENLGGGIYFYRFIIDDEQINSGKVVIVK
ncbi:MAG: T9SS type A sorting domain-containing protein, partial [Bacteroidetes bacterium]|nr:T9SS type A sorting domain-containing protein [Bacteroidota bacterium]